MTQVSDILYAYASALEEDNYALDSIDAVALDLNWIANAMVNFGTNDLSDDDISSLRSRLQLCPVGLEHWDWTCDQYHEVD